jgi:hypothetical protein
MMKTLSVIYDNFEFKDFNWLIKYKIKHLNIILK